ncbi:hypothetical protein JCM10450v2_000164 [Rhodotorula kratochvilovae]
MAYPHGDPRSLPLPALPSSPALASPPPVIVYTPEQPGAYARRFPAEEEKDAYFARSASIDSYGSHSHDGHQHWADAPALGAPAPIAVGGGRAAAAPAPLMLPPRAAFASEPGSPRSPMSLKQAMAFGDVGSVLDEKVGGRGAADVRKSGLDWARFSRMVKESEGEKESEWLRRKKGVSKKWWVLGWCGSICVVIAIVVALVVHFKSPSEDTMPSVPNLGGFNSKAVYSGSSDSMVSSLRGSQATGLTAAATTGLTAAATTSAAVAATTSVAAAVEDVEETTAAATSSTTTQRAVAAAVTTTSSVRTTTTVAATSSTTTPAVVRTTTTSAAPSSTTTTSARRAAAAAAETATLGVAADADAERREKRWLRFGQDGRSARADRKAWDAIDFVHPSIGDARKRHLDARGAAH